MDNTGTHDEAAMTAVEVVGGYDGRNVVRSFSATVGKGEFVGIVGPNGAGKSTCLRLLSGVLPLRHGDVLLMRRSVASNTTRELARTLAYVPQNEPALFDFTVREVVLMGRHPYQSRFGVARDDDYAQVDQAMVLTDIAHLADRPITELSGGEHRRVLIARAIAQSTPILLLDEPTAHLDMVHQFEVLTLMRRLCDERGTAVVAALHDLNAAAEHCTRLFLFSEGRVMAQGTPEVVLTAENVRAAYGGPVLVTKNPVTGKPFLMPQSPAAGGLSTSRPAVHLICGGGTGGELMAELRRFGYRLSAGVLNKKDSDEAAATALGIPCAREAPFSTITDSAFTEALQMARAADAIVVTAIPIGRGNLRNLLIALESAGQGARLILVNEPPVTSRDFTGGRGAELWHQLESIEAFRVSGVAQVLAALRTLEERQPGRAHTLPRSNM